jgi:hypothetical protein
MQVGRRRDDCERQKKKELTAYLVEHHRRGHGHEKPQSGGGRRLQCICVYLCVCDIERVKVRITCVGVEDACKDVCERECVV